MERAARCGLFDLPILSILALTDPGGTATNAAIDFGRDIRPILSNHCFPCHGPDDAARRAELRLDRFESATQSRENTSVIVPHQPERSNLMTRITAHDADEQMPPPEFEKPLSSGQIETLRAWIASGANYTAHWAFEKLPNQVEPPRAASLATDASPIDHFVRAQLERAGIEPSPPAADATLMRRLALDLTGMPPDAADRDALLAGQPLDVAAYVERLLASPRYGERMAQWWLDIARYADSYGYQSDQLNTLWPWRDFVVRAFDQNLPFDRFLTWQIAGDLIPEANTESRLATAFNRLHRMTNEGGSIHEEFRVEGVADRVNTLGAAFLGLTLECARCHDHKFDPVSQRDYYSLAGYFHDIDEEGTYEASHLVPSPSLLLSTEEQQRKLEEAQAKVVAARAELVTRRAYASERLSRIPAKYDPSAPIPDLVLAVDFERNEGGKALGRDGKGLIEVGSAALEVGPRGTSVRLDGDDPVVFDPELIDGGLGDRHVPFTIAFALELPATTPREAVVLACRSGGTDAGYHGLDLVLVDHHLEARLFRVWPGNARSIRSISELPLGRFVDIAWSYDGSDRADGLKLYVDGSPLPCEVTHDTMHKSSEPAGPFGGPFQFGARFRDRGTKDARLDDVHVFARALSPLEIATLAGRAQPTGPSPEELAAWYCSAIDEECRSSSRAMSAAVRRLIEIEGPIAEVPVMRESNRQRPIHSLRRGRYDDPDRAQTLERGVPTALGPQPESNSNDRLALATWLTQKDHPLTARVLVNRLWALLFGRGLVTTLEDLGSQGDWPSHPELLDWLARDFVDHGFDVQRTIRQIVLSQTYQQASRVRPDLATRDPENRLLARGPAKRLSAEMLRDSVLAASGLLVDRVGGPPVSPYQPANFWTESNSMSPAYQQSEGDGLYRRSLYTVWKRTAPMPNMTLFDAPSREACVVRRPRTNTPLQALVLLNDVQFVEACRVLATRACRERATTEERIEFMIRALTNVSGQPIVRSELLALHDSELARFTRDADATQALLLVGAKNVDESIPAPELAACTVVAQALLNLDATIVAR